MKKLTLGRMALFALAVLAVPAAMAAGFDIAQLFTPEGMGALMLANAPLAISEQIKLFEAKRQAAQDGATAIVNKSVEDGRTLDEVETEQHKQYATEIETIDAHLKLLKSHEQLMLSQGTTSVPRDAGMSNDPAPATKGVELRGGVLAVKSNLPPGVGFTRFALAMAQAKGNVMLAHEIAKNLYHDTPQVENCLKAAISMGGTKYLTPLEDHPMLQKTAVTAVSGTDTAVTQYMDIQSDFINLLRPKLVMGRMPSLSRVPFLSRLGRQLTGVTGSFVGEGSPKPVQKQTYDNVTLGYAKVAVIVVLTDEGSRFGTIDVQMRARDDMIKGIATYIDKRFMDPSYSGVANVSPASITNGATRVQSSGTTLAAIDADVLSMMAPYSTSDVDPTTAVWVMNATTALRLALKRNTYDEPAFPGMQNAIKTGAGDWYGLPVIVSNSMIAAGSPNENQIALVTQEEVSLADDGNVAIDMSAEASVQMNDAPSAGAQSLVSLWQNNLLGIRAEQYINWGCRRASNLGIMLLENVRY